MAERYRAIAIAPHAAELAAALHASVGFSETWDAKAFAELLAMPGAAGHFATTDKDEPVGLILWRIAADEGEILTIGVAPGWRRRKAGAFLLESAEAVMRQAGAARVFLEVAVDNAAAAALYYKHGFRAEGLRPGYYRTQVGHVDASVFAKNLS